jgi:hypothetical protein
MNPLELLQSISLFTIYFTSARSYLTNLPASELEKIVITRDAFNGLWNWILVDLKVSVAVLRNVWFLACSLQVHFDLWVRSHLEIGLRILH